MKQSTKAVGTLLNVYLLGLSSARATAFFRTAEWMASPKAEGEKNYQVFFFVDFEPFLEGKSKK